MKIKNKHGRVGVKQPLSTMEKRRAFIAGYRRGAEDTLRAASQHIERSTSLRTLKKEWFIG